MDVLTKVIPYIEILPRYRESIGARGSVIGWGTVVEVARSQVRFPMKSLNLPDLRNPSSHTMTPGLSQPLTEMTTTNLPGE
jgi:hypothetical protein